MEKAECGPVQKNVSRPLTPRRSLRPRTNIILITTLCLVSACLWLSNPLSYRQAEPRAEHVISAHDDSFVDWDAITPSEELSWVPCFHYFGEFLCARLTVALDPARPLNASATHPKVHIAMVLVPGEGHSLENGNWSESPLLTNPGGPGGEGTATIAALGTRLQTAIGPHLDIVGFDPRGIGGTTPPADCFLPPRQPGQKVDRKERNTALLHRATFLTAEKAFGYPESSTARLTRSVQLSRSMSTLCQDYDYEDSIFRYLGIPHVAQDMHSIVQAWDRWTAKINAEKQLMTHAQPPLPTKELRDESSALHPPVTRGKLVYWGWSYGTILGATYASMFPESVGRLVLDAVVDTDLYIKNTWFSAVQDNDAVLETFFRFCHEAGTACSIYRAGDQPNDIKQRFDLVMEALRQEPIVLVGPGPSRIPFTISYIDVKQIVLLATYLPTMLFPLVAYIINLIYSGENLSPIAAPPDLAPLCHADLGLITYPGDANIGCLCGDQRWQTNRSKEAINSIYQELSNVTWFSDIWMNIMTACLYWDIKPIDPPAFDLNAIPTGSASVNTSFPILFVSNTLDPVTPMSHGLIQSRRFAGSGFIEQKSQGHTSLAEISLCTIRKIAAYLNNGTLVPPPKLEPGTLAGEWVTCESDERPWKPFNAKAELRRLDVTGWSEHDITRMHAWKELQSEIPLDGEATDLHHNSLRRVLEFAQGAPSTPLSVEKILRDLPGVVVP